MKPKSVNLVLPGLFKSLQKAEVEAFDECRSPLFQNILSKSTYHHHSAAEKQTLPYDYISKLPLASYECNEVKQAGVSVLYADPVFIDIKSDHIVAYPVSVKNHKEIILVLIDKFNEYFSVDGLSLKYLPSGRLICNSLNKPVPEMSPSYSIYGRDVKHFLPQGDGDKFWLRLFNEVQMFLHEYIEEAERTFDGQLLNGFWFWGANNLNDIPSSNDTFIGSVDWLKGFCLYHDLEHGQLEDIKDSQKSDFNIIDESLLYCSSIGDVKLWLASLNKIETEILQPLVNLLTSRVINKITIQVSDSSFYEYKSIHRLRFYRKQTPLNNICVVES